ncbi:MAG TPA: IPT/TIG domain-containing protein [Paludibacter sp.]
MNKLFISLLLVSTLLYSGCKVVDEPKDVVDTTLSITDFTPKTGGEKTVVIINGKNFASAVNYNLIKIGSYSLIPLTSSATQLTFVIPTGMIAGDYSITVMVGGVSVVSTDKFNVDPSKPGGGGFVNNDKVPSITATIVNNCFFGTGQTNIHPRIFYSADDIQRIKSLVLTDVAAKTAYDGIISAANSLLSQPVLKWGLDADNLRISNIHSIGNDIIPALVLAYQFTGDTRYAQRCYDQLAEMMTWSDWGAGRHFLDTGIGSKGVAMAYDGLYDFLTPDQRTKIVAAARKFALEPGLAQMKGGPSPFAWYLTVDNWNGICHGGLIDLALAMYETDTPFMGQVISIAANQTLGYMTALGPDGASREGMMYWDYGLTNTFMCYEAMNRVLSTTYGLAEQPGFVKTGWFPFLVTGPAGTASVGDDYLYNSMSSKFTSRLWFAKKFNDANLAKAEFEAMKEKSGTSNGGINGWMDLLAYDPALISQGNAVSLPMFGNVHGLDYMFVRENDTDDSYYIGMHGGDNAASHGHLDAGTFFLHAKGQVFASGTLGTTAPYPADYFNGCSPDYNTQPTTTTSTPGRNYYYRVRTEGKSCVIFNPDARPMENPTGVCIVDKELNDGIGGCYVLNMNGIYGRDASSYKRGIKLNRSTKVTSIQDEFTPISSSTVYWIMQTIANISINPSNKKMAKLTIGTKVIYAIIKSPAEAAFEYVTSSTGFVNYLSETKPIFSTIMIGKDQTNGGYGKLQFKLTGVTASTTIRVDFVDATTTVVPDITAMSNWTTSN